ncbi:hypothetical protein Dcar01_03561 [Deinococcus carri]|uniref:DNA (cytosine-5-)-methyltransferase n=1 Tax=Deinococcus carri TaxID=1211323 RepID=A0ABP9WBV0_9DEIO
MRVVEMCCGYGGATAGMLAAGLTIEKSYDIWPVAVEQHRAWHPEVPCEARDVATITPEELRGRLVWASLPCQPWSRANVRTEKRGKKHPHYYSLAHFARQVQYARCTVIENVPGLVETQDGQAELQALADECNRLGLTMTVHLIYSNWFGVPQERRRVFIVLGRGIPLTLIQPYGSVKAENNAVTCHSSGYNVFSQTQKKRQRSVYATESDTMSTTDPRTGEQIFFGRSIEQCAELQGVPVPPKHLPKKAQFTLVGNVVPPRLARAIAEQVFVPLLAQGVSA